MLASHGAGELMMRGGYHRSGGPAGVGSAVIVIAPQRLGNSQVAQQLGGNARVFASDRIAAREDVGGALRHVAEVAYRGRDNIEAGRKRFGSFVVAHAALVAHIMRKPQACWRSPGHRSGGRSPSDCSPYFSRPVRSCRTSAALDLSRFLSRTGRARTCCRPTPHGTGLLCWCRCRATMRQSADQSPMPLRWRCSTPMPRTCASPLMTPRRVPDRRRRARFPTATSSFWARCCARTSRRFSP